MQRCRREHISSNGHTAPGLDFCVLDYNVAFKSLLAVKMSNWCSGIAFFFTFLLSSQMQSLFRYSHRYYGCLNFYSRQGRFLHSYWFESLQIFLLINQEKSSHAWLYVDKVTNPLVDKTIYIYVF